ncbi:MAG: tRNA (cytidine(56)-2'-O)-methyltransferase [Cenarchaeum sp. SB0665_bin_23]|nr:tRNA (cytidine(56)-2'-O)-methyltransferase [Cenarchaeum sp. SB0667_bin_13]MXY37446.1 tRNA (cytidine(56)-2'-O)-methyltransferase [Cenarchaeum sp. SB0664_bin_35]MXY60942.1 tRNA (cytidine(56)-2'-O)-methyltransferase [Cenarchaeum sp. SB0665_bin_23]MXZ93782.1 tRNA (cytidine(56)-2'-O)-methyltransferase [Cenarchaeum sp. SB0666_bin_15]MYB47585.1 tRNA (cytidine(56)-2'-O)-methyltransferase [Cenarchaeum sp. SB0662_bin_33]MYC79931.1 tRNA (cytidine(56)-2'-O)-methyltransferase [Cenarchaeum sp. SB0661_bin
MIVEVARLGQRLVRDDRVTTHAALVSRAFGASRIYMSDTNAEIQDTMRDINKRWGGSFDVILEDNIKEIIRQKKRSGYFIVHLTMYGYTLYDYLKSYATPDRVLIVIGAGKVPREIYDMADYNVSVGLQPHSEIAALAVFLDHIQDKDHLDREFPGANKRIIPSRTGKCVSDL